MTIWQEQLSAEMKVLVVIPALNEEESITGVIHGIRAMCRFDILVIDDGSEDETASRARLAGATVLVHGCNLGIGGAVQSGFLYAVERGYDFAVRIDGDGQHNPVDIPRLLEIVERDEADIVVGSRFLNRQGYQSTWIRRIGIIVLRILSSAVGTSVTDPTSGYWALNRRALTLLSEMHPDDYPEIESLVIATRAGLRTREIPVAMLHRAAGSSSISAIQSGFYMIKVIVAVLFERIRHRPSPEVR